MGSKGLYNFIFKAISQWKEHRRICYAIRSMLAGTLLPSAPPIVHLMHLLALEAAKGKYDALAFACDKSEDLEFSMLYMKNGSVAAGDNLPYRIIEPLLDCFDILAECSGRLTREDKDHICISKAEFWLPLDGRQVKLAITKEQPNQGAIGIASHRLGEIFDELAECSREDDFSKSTDKIPSLFKISLFVRFFLA